MFKRPVVESDEGYIPLNIDEQPDGALLPNLPAGEVAQAPGTGNRQDPIRKMPLGD